MRPIVVGVSGRQDRDAGALGYVAAARREVIAVHVRSHAPAAAWLWPGWELGAQLIECRDSCEEQAFALARASLRGGAHGWHFLVRDGTVAVALADVASQVRAALIVVGSRNQMLRRRSIARALGRGPIPVLSVSASPVEGHSGGHDHVYRIH